MLKKRLSFLLLLAVTAVASLFAEKLLPFYEFDFNAYIDTYHQLIVNDVFLPGEETPFYDSLEKALGLLDRNLDADALEAQVRKKDREGLKSYVSSVIEKGEMLTEDEIVDVLFDPDNMYSAFVTPTTDSAMSYFGHSFLLFYIEEAPLLSPCVNFYAYYEHLGALGTVFAGLAGSLESYYDLKPFYFSFLDYMAARDRAIRMYRFHFDEMDEKMVHSVILGLATGDFSNYSFLFNNCSHGFLDIIRNLADNLDFPMDRAISPATAMRIFRDSGIIDKPEFEFPAWNDVITSESPLEFRDYYRSLQNHEVGFESAEPFENFPIRREVTGDPYVSNRFSSLTFTYEGGSEHRFGLWFKPVFNDFIEQNYVDHEIMNLHALNGGISAKIDRKGEFVFESFEAELFSFDSIFPFTTLKKRPSFGANLSLGVRDMSFLAETEGYIGMALGRSDIFWFIGLDNLLSTVPLQYTLNARNMIGAKLGPVTLMNTTDMVLFSTLHDCFHVENRLSVEVDIIDSLSLIAYYKLSTKEAVQPEMEHMGGVSLVYNFNIF